MADHGLAGEAVKIASGFGGFGGGLYFARWLITWVTGRHDRREADLRAEDGELDQKWRVYREAIETRCEKLEGTVERLERENEDCHAKNIDLEKRLARLEGFASARGDLRNAAQAEQSAAHLIDDAADG